MGGKATIQQVLLLALYTAAGQCCCYGGPPSGTAVFYDMTVEGTCTGCSGDTTIYKVENTASSWPDISNNGEWAEKETFESSTITVTGAAVNDVCIVSVLDDNLKGDKTGHNLYCYVSAANSVTLVMSIGTSDIDEGGKSDELQNNFPVSVAVISMT